VLMGRVMSGQKGRTIITCNANDFFYKMIEEWVIEKPESWSAVNSASISMIIEYPNNVWRFLAYVLGTERSGEIETKFNAWKKIQLSESELSALQERVSVKRIIQNQELTTIWETFRDTGRLICPHTANAVAGLREYRSNTNDTTPALISETASPWKFLAATAAGLSFEDTQNIDALYTAYRDLEKTKNGCERLLNIIAGQFGKYWREFSMDLLPQNLREIYATGFEMWEVREPDEFHAETLKFLNEYAGKLKRQVLKLIQQ
jgi:threonine synthase